MNYGGFFKKVLSFSMYKGKIIFYLFINFCFFVFCLLWTSDSKHIRYFVDLTFCLIWGRGGRNLYILHAAQSNFGEDEIKVTYASFEGITLSKNLVTA